MLSLVKTDLKTPVNYCTFCGNPEDQCEILILGAIASICDRCSDLVADLVAAKRAKTLETAQ